jgi:hypothetical protein
MLLVQRHLRDAVFRDHVHGHRDGRAWRRQSVLLRLQLRELQPSELLRRRLVLLPEDQLPSGHSAGA